MSVTCTTSDHLTYVCGLGGQLVDWLGVMVQGVWFGAGAVLCLGIVLSGYLVVRRMTS